VINYDGRRFGGPGAEAHYHHEGDLVWAEIQGADVRRGSLTGICGAGGRLAFAYTMVLSDGGIVSGRCESTPEVLADGRLALHEQWERYLPHPARGCSTIEEVR
jgi:hypothetical protein